MMEQGISLSLGHFTLFSNEVLLNLFCLYIISILGSGAHPRGGLGPFPLGPEKHYIFRVSSIKLRDLHLCSLFLYAFCYVGGLRKPAAW